MLTQLVQGLVRQPQAPPFYLDSEHPQGINRRGAQYVQDDLPSLTTLVNEGVCWQVGEATAVAAVTTMPTTTAQITLYNNEAEGGKTYIVLSVFGIQVANGAALNSWGIAHCVNVAKPSTLPTADIATTSIKSLKARQGSYGGNAIVDLAATVVDDLWKPVGAFAGTTVVSLSGTQIDVPLNGAVILPPGGEYSLVAIASATGITTRLGFRWAEVQL